MMVFDRHSKAALVVASLTLAVCNIGFRAGIGAANAYLQKEPVPLRDQLRSIPKRLGKWQAIGEDRELTVEFEEALGTPHYLDRDYVLDTGGRVRTWLRVHIAYYTGMIDAVPHVPDRCLEVAGLVKMGLPVNLDLH
ncbi:MAG: exosortase-associated EpsI family protein, partial [Planctomycetes bacterium]|nr:exosortase-associated EpsI family protein [Planctomycetota bacterium]